jgi:uncharacterized membrane protein YedE/YeeE
MIFFGNPMYRLVSGVISIVILVVVYFTIIKPTEHTVSSAINQGFKHFGHTTATPNAGDKLARCLVRANGKLHKVKRCEARFQP